MKTVLLDSGPLGLLAYVKVAPVATQCRDWLRALLAANAQVIVPEIADYEVRRELLRGGLTRGVERLDALIASPGVSYLPLSTGAMRRAAEFWAEARRRGTPTADHKALDGDVILAAQAHLLIEEGRSAVIATTNVAHLSRFVPAAEWETVTV